MINIFDGNNILYRALSDTSLHAASGMNIRQRYLSLKPSDIWVFDGARHNDRRVAVYPPYKGNREPTPMNMAAQIKLFKQLLVHSPATMIEVHGWEADDVIGTIARRGARITVHTNDMDYVQLSRFANVTLNGVKTKDVDPSELALFKAMVGDPSDNIKGIPGFGSKAWDNLQGHRRDLLQAVQAGDPAGFVGLPVTPAVARWLANAENIATLQAMLLITHFWTVPEDELNAGITRGVPNPAAAEALLTRYLL